MANKCWFVYYSWIEAIDSLSDSEAGRLLKCCLKYSSTGEGAILSGNERPIWLMIKPQIDRDNARAEEISQKRKEAGALSRSNCNQLQANATNCNQVNKRRGEEKKRREEESIVKAPAFTPPSLEEISAYCAERQNGVDPQHFLDYYTSNGWKVGRNSMKDWKAAVRTWEQKNRPAAKKTNNIFAEIAMEEGIF